MNLKFLLYFLLIASSVSAQEYEIDPDEIYRPPLMKIMNMFSVTVSTGYNSTTYSHDLSGFYLLQNATDQYISPNLGVPLGAEFDIYSDWFNNAQLSQTVVALDTFDVPFRPIDNPVYNPALVNDLVAYNADSLGLGFKGRGWSIPLNIGLRYNYKKFRIGGGISMEFHKVKSLKPTVDGIGIRSYQPNFSSAFFFSYYGQLGYLFYDFWDYSFAAEIEIGKNKMGGNFNKALINQGVLVNLGISIEKNLSEYFRIIVKPSYDFKNYQMAVPGTGIDIKHKNPTFKLNFGISITFPEIPRTPVKSDGVQLKHVIRDPNADRYIEVRGQPIWKVQNPKVGQNYRKIWRYKYKNKKKINPY